MCGIHASISTDGYKFPSSILESLLCNRGPDHTGKFQVEVEENGQSHFLSFTSTVLALRGGHVTPQPFVDPKTGSILCWNGEAWKFGSQLVLGENDGQILFKTLLVAAAAESYENSSNMITHSLRAIYGPFSFVFWDRLHGRIYFGRDRLGRRSLLYNSTSLAVEFSSTSDPLTGDWKEVDADGIYELSYSKAQSHVSSGNDTNKFLMPPTMSLTRYEWEDGFESSGPTLGIFNRSIPSGEEALNIMSQSVDDLLNCLRESLKLRVLNIPVPPATTLEQNARIAVLFSGGLDCTVLARMAHDILPLDYQIDLINVAFENPRVVQAAKNALKPAKSKQKGRSPETVGEQASTNPLCLVVDNELSPYEACPDRETGRKSFLELLKICPTRTWRFVSVDVPYSETIEHKSKVVSLIYPHNTEMDLSIAYALYFASRGTGNALTTPNEWPIPYTTTARVLLSGLGADELFGGYTRHSTAFQRMGFTGLIDELELDVNRLGKRNLGRDDRVLSQWGREARFPYLDESLVKWAVETPVSARCGFRMSVHREPETPSLEPGKKVLRLLAHRLNMFSVSQEKKRAIQFGARTAKMEVGRTKGTTIIS